MNRDKRNFLGAGGIFLGGVIAGCNPFGGTDSTDSRPIIQQTPQIGYTDQELSEMIVILERQIEEDREMLATAREPYKDVEEQMTAYEAKYGTSDAPVVTVSDDFEHVSFERERINTVVKDDNYFNTLFDLAENIGVLTTDLMFWRDRMDADPELPDISALLEDPDIKRSYVQTSQGDRVEIDSVDMMISLISNFAGSDMQPGALDSTLTLSKTYQFFEAIDQIRQMAPEFVREDSNEASIRQTLDRVIGRILNNYPEVSPDFIVYPSQEQFLAENPDPRVDETTAAFHRPVTDSIETYAKPLYDHIITLSHEVGHVASRMHENGLIEEIERHNEISDQVEGHINAREELVLLVREILETEDPELKGQLIAEAEDKYFDIQLQGTNLSFQNFGAQLFGGAMGGYSLGHLGLDESAAYLFQEVVITEIARENPVVGDALFKIRDIKVHTTDREHFAPYALAEELKAQYGGNALTAFRAIANIQDPDQINEYERRLDQIDYAEYGFFGIPMDLSVRFQLMDRSERSFDRIKSIGQEWFDNSNDPAYRETAEQRIQETQKAVAGLFKQYMALVQ